MPSPFSLILIPAVLVALLLGATQRTVAEDAAVNLILADGGKSDYRIVIAEAASPAVHHAAEELRRFIAEISKADLPIVTDATPPQDHEIILGSSKRTDALKLDLAPLGEEGYLLSTAGPQLLILGGGNRGTLYGVYGLLDDHLGCRWFTPAISRIPQLDRIVIKPLNESYRPRLEYREVMLFDCWQPDWYARNRLNTTQMMTEKYGGAVRYVPDYYVHTFYKFIPPEKYFADHPEYFSENDGRRTAEKAQICLTNQAVAAIIIDQTRRLFRDNPQCRVISVSQTDSNDNYCRCHECKTLIDAEGTPAAPILLLINRVAEAIAEEFPNHAIETLAYEWSRKPPRTMRPRDNVIIRLSTIRCSFSEPLATSMHSGNRSFRRDLEAWGKICKRIWIWDYVTYFSYYLLPFPNYHVLDDNIRFFIDNGVRGIVEQDNWQSPNGELAGLTGYLAARFLWNPDADEQRTTVEYLEGVYGPAAPHIRAYMKLLTEKVTKDKIPLPIYGSRTPAYLDIDTLKAADPLWQQAADAVADNPELLKRVQIARLSFDYAYIEHYRFKPGEMVQYEGNPRRNKVIGINPDYAARIRRFLLYAPQSGMTHIREGESDYKAFESWLQGLFPKGQAE